MTRNSERGPGTPTLGEDARYHIGTELQAVFASIEGEPIPNEHVDLLLALRRKERDRARTEFCPTGRPAVVLAAQPREVGWPDLDHSLAPDGAP